MRVGGGFDPGDMVSRGVESSEQLCVSLMSLAKDEEKDTLKLFPINDVDDEVDGGIQRHLSWQWNFFSVKLFASSMKDSN